jgi:hypothetical protein
VCQFSSSANPIYGVTIRVGLHQNDLTHQSGVQQNVMMQSFWNLNWTWACCPKGHNFHTGEQHPVSDFGKTQLHQDRPS